MSKQAGWVREIQKDGYAVVVTDRKGACSGCHQGSDGRSSCRSEAKIESRVANPIYAREGDVVEIRLKSSALFKSATLFYLFPVVGMMVGAFAGIWISGRTGGSEAMPPVLGALAGLALSLGLVIRIGRSRYGRSRMTPVIDRVIIPSADRMTQAGRRVAVR